MTALGFIEPGENGAIALEDRGRHQSPVRTGLRGRQRCLQPRQRGFEGGVEHHTGRWPAIFQLAVDGVEKCRHTLAAARYDRHHRAAKARCQALGIDVHALCVGDIQHVQRNDQRGAGIEQLGAQVEATLQ